MKIHTIQFKIEDWLAGVNGMDASEVGAYFNLLIACYQDKDHSLPDDDVRLSRMARCTPKVWSRVREAVRAKFVAVVHPDTGKPFLQHERVLKDAQSYSARSTNNQSNALKMWERRKRLAQEAQSERNATQYPLPIKDITPLTPQPEPPPSATSTDVPRETEKGLNSSSDMGLGSADASQEHDGKRYLYEEFPLVKDAHDFKNHLPIPWVAVLQTFIEGKGADGIDWHDVATVNFWDKWVGRYPGDKDDQPYARKGNWFKSWEHELENISRKRQGLGPKPTPKGIQNRLKGNR